MRWKILLALAGVYAVVLVGIIVIGVQNEVGRRPLLSVGAGPLPPSTLPANFVAQRPVVVQPNMTDEADLTYKPNDPSLQQLLHLTAKQDSDRKSRFFAVLTELFRQNNEKLTDNEPGLWIEEGRAVELGDKGHVVAILRGWDRAFPGRDTQYLFLFDKDGKIVDKLSCGVNAKLTRWSADRQAAFRTEQVLVPGQKDPLLQIRYVPSANETFSGSWSHKIVYQSKSYTYPWKQVLPTDIAPEEFEIKGLCRLAVKDGRFVVVFPELKNPVE
jgi:hypothetical protein